MLYQYFPGEGLQLHPLSTFKKANLIHGACERGEPSCDEAALRRAARRDDGARRAARGAASSPGSTCFYFDGGAPPWISGMARGHRRSRRSAAPRELLERPDYLDVAAQGARRVRDAAAARRAHDRLRAAASHYLQYSFAPRLYIFNAFLQSLIGLYDFEGSPATTRATQLFEDAEPEAREEVPL